MNAANAKAGLSIQEDLEHAFDADAVGAAGEEDAGVVATPAGVGHAYADEEQVDVAEGHVADEKDVGNQADGFEAELVVEDANQGEVAAADVSWSYLTKYLNFDAKAAPLTSQCVPQEQAPEKQRQTRVED